MWEDSEKFKGNSLKNKQTKKEYLESDDSHSDEEKLHRTQLSLTHSQFVRIF